MNTQSEAQRAAALEKANKVRLAKKRAKQKLRSGEITLMTALLHPPAVVREMRLEELLLATPGIGPRKARLVLMRAHVSASVKVRSCSRESRENILAKVAVACPAVWRRLDA